MISLLYCGNGAMFHGILLSSLSAAMHSTQPPDVHIFTMDLTEKDPRFTPITAAQAAFIETELCSLQEGSRVTLHDLGELYRTHLQDSPNAATGYTPYALLRLLVDKTEGLPARLLYLDTDTLVLRDLAPLLSWHTGGCAFAAARDHLGKFFIHPRYMNTGVMLLDTQRLKESDLLPRARALCNARKFPFPDQDVLNRCVGKRCFLPRRYNEQYACKDDTVIRHFSKTIRFMPVFHTINIKPWDVEGIQSTYRTDRYDGIFAYYQQALKGWKDT